MQRIVCLLLVALAGPSGVATISGRSEPLTIQVSPTIVPAPAHVSVRMRIEPDARSRALSIEWWSGDGSGGSHLITLQGERSATRHEYAIRHMNAGEYEVIAVLTRDDGTEVRRKTTVLVVGRV